MKTSGTRCTVKMIVVTNCLFFLFQSLGCDRPVNYKTENLDQVLKKEYPVSEKYPSDI